MSPDTQMAGAELECVKQVLAYSGYGPESFADIYEGKRAVSKNKLSGQLYLPAGDDPFPVVVLQHGSGNPAHLTPWWKKVVPALLREGIGSFIANGCRGRGIGSTASDQRKVSKAARTVDALMALEALAAHPKIDGNRVGIAGYSFEGIVSYESADRRTVETVLGPDQQFAAHLPVYPSCQVQREKIDMTGRPMLFLVGKEDNDTPAQPCKEFVARIKAARLPAALNMYTNAGHNIVKVKRGNYDDLATFSKYGRGTMNLDGHEFMGNASTRNTTWAQCVIAVFHQCGDRRAELYGTKGVATPDTVGHS